MGETMTNDEYKDLNTVQKAIIEAHDLLLKVHEIAEISLSLRDHIEFSALRFGLSKIGRKLFKKLQEEKRS